MNSKAVSNIMKWNNTKFSFLRMEQNKYLIKENQPKLFWQYFSFWISAFLDSYCITQIILKIVIYPKLIRRNIARVSKNLGKKYRNKV